MARPNYRRRIREDQQISTDALEALEADLETLIRKAEEVGGDGESATVPVSELKQSIRKQILTTLSEARDFKIEHNLKSYAVTVQHDEGTIVFRVKARSEKAAKEMVMRAEGCPERAILSVELIDGDRSVSEAKGEKKGSKGKKPKKSDVDDKDGDEGDDDKDGDEGDDDKDDDEGPGEGEGLDLDVDLGPETDPEPINDTPGAALDPQRIIDMLTQIHGWATQNGKDVFANQISNQIKWAMENLILNPEEGQPIPPPQGPEGIEGLDGFDMGGLAEIVQSVLSGRK